MIDHRATHPARQHTQALDMPREPHSRMHLSSPRPRRMVPCVYLVYTNRAQGGARCRRAIATLYIEALRRRHARQTQPGGAIRDIFPLGVATEGEVVSGDALGIAVLAVAALVDLRVRVSTPEGLLV